MMGDPMSKPLTIGRLAELAGVTPDTIRYYERVGVLPKPTRTPSGYRQYPDLVVNRLRLVRNAQQFGFSLREIAGFLHVRAAGGAPCRAVRDAGQRMLEAIDQQISALVSTRRQMHDTLTAWDRALAGKPGDRPAYLLEALADSTTQPSPPRRGLQARRRAVT